MNKIQRAVMQFDTVLTDCRNRFQGKRLSTRCSLQIIIASSYNLFAQNVRDAAFIIESLLWLNVMGGLKVRFS